MSVESIRHLAGDLPECPKARLQIYRAAKQLMERAETPRDTCFRLFGSHGPAAAGITAVELGVFRALAKDPSRRYSLKELADSTGADPKLLIRLLKTLAAWGYVDLPALETFQASNTTLALATPFGEGLAQAVTRFNAPMFHVLPDYLKETGYKNPIDGSYTPFHKAYKTSLKPMDWFGENLEWANKVMSFMSVQRDGQIPWMTRPEFLQGYDISLSAPDLAAKRTLFVDIGGAVGHQCIAFRTNHPDLEGKVIMQDLPIIADLAAKDPRISELDITIQPHDFMEPQTPEGTGAKVYYIRNVLHDWNDEKCAEILKRIREAMAEDSILIIDEALVPDVDVAIQVVTTDMVMMAFPAAQERSEGMWRDLVEGMVGLKIRDIRKYDESTRDSLLFVTKG